MKEYLIDPEAEHARLRAFTLDCAKQLLSRFLIEQVRVLHLGDRTRCVFKASTQDSNLLFPAQDAGWIEIVAEAYLPYDKESIRFLFTSRGVDALLPVVPTGAP